MTMPTGPAPRPLPNPGPPPTPSGWHYTDTQPGPGPKPTGPTGPAPTGPGRLPTLADIVLDATKVLNAAIVMLGRQWDPTTGPSDQCDPWGPEAVDIHLGSAVADIRSAIRELAAITTMSSARQSTNSASLPGGPFNHPVRRPDEGLTPGLAAGAEMAASARSDGAPTPLAGSSHLTRPLPRASGGLLPGLADATVSPTAGGTGESNTTRFGRDAGESSDPRPRIGGDAPEMTGVPTPPDQRNSVRPGVGFTVPSAKPWMWSS